MTIPLQFASLYDRQEVFVWSNCLLDLGTNFHVGNMALYEMCRAALKCFEIDFVAVVVFVQLLRGHSRSFGKYQKIQDVKNWLLLSETFGLRQP